MVGCEDLGRSRWTRLDAITLVVLNQQGLIKRASVGCTRCNQSVPILKKSRIMSVFVKIENESEFVSLVLDAVELPDFKLKCEITCEPRVETSSGEVYAAELIRILCSDGWRLACKAAPLWRGNGPHLGLGYPRC